MNPTIKRNLKKIFPFGIIWCVYGIVYVLLEKGMLGDLDYYPATGNDYNFLNTILLTPVLSMLLGWVFGAAEVFWLDNMFNNRTFVVKIILKTVIYTFALMLIIMIVSIIVNSTVMGLPVYHPEILQSFKVFFGNLAFWSIMIFTGSIMSFSLFVHEISDNLGLHVVANFFTGKYHKPKEETRIFMFLDMKSSTTIAEKLGHVRYFDLLNQYFKDMSPSIIATSGEIYQYVGDEIIVSWRPKNGLRNNNCLQCFFKLKAAFRGLADFYIEKYGHVPEFKAGFHVGKVTTGEIGSIKKEIVFSGDVLNTTARIQELCNKLHVDNLVSDELLHYLGTKIPLTLAQWVSIRYGEEMKQWSYLLPWQRCIDFVYLTLIIELQILRERLK